jgi:hypothetical protein
VLHGFPPAPQEPRGFDQPFEAAELTTLGRQSDGMVYYSLVDHTEIKRDLYTANYRQTIVQRHFNTFNCSKCLKQVLAATRFFGHQTRHHANHHARLCLAALNRDFVAHGKKLRSDPC